MSQNILFVVADCPGYYINTIYEMAKLLSAHGYQPFFAATSPFYESIRGISLSKLGPVYYLSDFFTKSNTTLVESIRFEDYWAIYPTYVRLRYFLGKHENKWGDYRYIPAFFQSILAKHTIQLIVGEPPTNSFFYFGFLEAKKINIPYLGYISGRLRNCYNVFLDEYGLIMQENPSPLSLSTLDDSAPDYMNNPANKLESGFLEKPLIYLIKKFFLTAFTAINVDSIEIGNPLLWQMKAHYKFLMRKILFRRAIYLDLFKKELASDHEKKINILFPLQFRPEASTSVLAREYESDIEIARNIAFSLGDGAMLYVKEHPSAVGIHSVSFYKELVSFPNTTILHPSYELKKNLLKFDAIVTLTSTVGFEALQKGIPVYVLGRVFYENYPGAHKVSTLCGLGNVLKNISKIMPVEAPEIISIYKNRTFPGSFNYINICILSNSNIELLLVPILNLLSNQKDGSRF